MIFDHAMRRLLFPLLALVLISGLMAVSPARGDVASDESATGESASGEKTMGDAATELVDRASAYLNALSTARARFAQVDHNGGVVQGLMMISRPGLLKFDYDAPVQVMIVAADGWVHFLDYEMGNTTSLPINRTPLGLLVRPQLDLARDARVLTAVRTGNAIRIALQAKDDEDEGTLTLEFDAEPFALRGWRVTDALDQQTRVVLKALERNISLPFDAFLYEDPETERDQSAN